MEVADGVTNAWSSSRGDTLFARRTPKLFCHASGCGDCRPSLSAGPPLPPEEPDDEIWQLTLSASPNLAQVVALLG